MIGKVIIEKLTDDFEIFDWFMITQSNLPPISYTLYVELEVSIKEMMDYNIPTQEQWKAMEKFGKTKYRLHQWWTCVTVQRSSSCTSSCMLYGSFKFVMWRKLVVIVPRN